MSEVNRNTAVHYDLQQESVVIQIFPEERQPAQLLECPICLEKTDESIAFRVRDCGCKFCLQCMKNYVSTLINSGEIHLIRCPKTFCPEALSSEEIELLCDQETFTKYLALKKEIDLANDPTRTVCPQVGCETECILHPKPGAEFRRQKVTCPECKHVFCSRCKANWHPLKSCKEGLGKSVKRPGRFLMMYPGDAPIKRCPRCHIPIERNAGCAQMMCKSCKHVFCWHCLQTLNDDFLLRHYDKGPCKNKLGHSRASVFMHRVQVVAMIAGIGLLLLFIAPFLLIAAPCILCGACRSCVEKL